MRIRLAILTILALACSPLRAGDGNVPKGRQLRLGDHPYALVVPADFEDANALAADANALLAARNRASGVTLRAFAPPADKRATVFTLARWYDDHLADRLPTAQKTHANWLTMEGTNALYRQSALTTDGQKREVHALLFVRDGVQLAIEAVTPPDKAKTARNILLSLHRLADPTAEWVPIGKTGYRIAPPDGWGVETTRKGNLRFKAPGGKVILNVHAVDAGKHDPNTMVPALAKSFRTEMDKTDGNWKLVATQDVDRSGIEGQLQYFLGRPNEVPSDLVVLHAAGDRHVFTLTAALPGGVRKQFAKKLVACMTSLRKGAPPSETEYRPLTVRRAGLQMSIPKAWATEDAGNVVKAVAPKDTPAAGTVLTVQVQPRSGDARSLDTAVKAFRKEMKDADGNILADAGAKVAGLGAHLFEAAIDIDGVRYRVNYLYLERAETLALVTYFTPEGKYTETRPFFIKALRSLRAFKPAKSRADGDEEDIE
jgi:hypothetical protein